MQRFEKLYIAGQWQTPHSEQVFNVINPATAEVCLQVPQGDKLDVERAILAARAAFDAWSSSSVAQRREYMLAIATQMEQRYDELVMAHVITMGCPVSIAGAFHVDAAIEAMRYYADQALSLEQGEQRANVTIFKEAVGVCGFINPWNYPLHQLVGKLAPALAAGCTVVAKPAEQTPLADLLMAQICDSAGLPAGVFNVVPGLGSELGPVLSSHPDIDLISFTGSTLSGVKVAQAAAPSVKRVCQELGGKSPYIITEDADLAAAVRYGVEDVMGNSGQTCNALTRMYLPASRYDEAVALAVEIASEQIVGDPLAAQTTLGPLASKIQLEKVRSYIELGCSEGARLVCGGVEAPVADSTGFYVAPTIFADVTQQMRIAREEIFGPVLCLIRYESIEQAITWANDTPYGLSSAVYAKDNTAALAVAKHIRAGQCYLQGSYFTIEAPFGGYKQSGNGREWGREALHEYLETKAVIVP